MTRAADHGIENLKGRIDPELARAVAVIHYDDLQPAFTTRAKAHVFSALDQLTPAQAEAVERIWSQLEAAQPAVRLLNHPRRALGRYGLLEALHRAGTNRFRAFRASGGWEQARYPVFVREETGHNGAQTQLLSSAREVKRALVSLTARGFAARDLLVVEYCDTRGADGHFRKYGALVLGDHVLPRHLLVGDHWMLKSAQNALDARTAEEELAYVRDNPHAAELGEVCRLAGIDYGRIDYAVSDGRPQVWEINTNPTLGPGRGGPKNWPPEVARLRDERRKIGRATMEAALRALDDGPEPPEAAVELPLALMSRMRHEAGARVRRQRAVAMAHRIYGHPVAGWPVRWLYSRVLARR